MCEKKSCPIWTLLSIVLALAALALFVFLVIKKVQMLRSYLEPSDEELLPIEGENPTEGKKETESGVRYTTDQDFV